MNINYSSIPQRTIDALDRYVNQRIRTGDFLYAVLSNNLMDAMGRADEENRAALFDICAYVYNEIPAISYGSEERIEAWLQNGSEEVAHAS